MCISWFASVASGAFDCLVVGGNRSTDIRQVAKIYRLSHAVVMSDSVMFDVCVRVVAGTERDARDLRHSSAYQYHNPPNVCIASKCKYSLNISWPPEMIQSGISTFPWIHTWWNRMKIGLDFSKPNPSRSDTSEAASSLSGYLR